MRLALCLEQTLGHRAHTANLARVLETCGTDFDFVKVEYAEGGRIPWAFTGSWRAAQQLRRRPTPDVRFYHTQSVSLFAPFVPRGRPYVVSVDATPRQIDGMGDWYNHGRSARAVESLKDRWYRLVFSRASALVAWSDWAAQSLQDDYRVPRGKVSVLHPGAPRQFFALQRPQPGNELPTILFVGGDLHRKGADLLLETFEDLKDRARLLLVTPDPVSPREGVEVVSHATPGSSALLDAYRRADIFCLPTRGDCTPVVLGEAMAAGLPVVTTRIGSNAETVTEGVTGLLTEPGNRDQLYCALDQLVSNPTRSRRMGVAGRDRAARILDAEQNALRLLALLRSVAR